MEDKQQQIEEVQIDPNLPQESQGAIIKAETENAKQGRLAGIWVLLIEVILSLLGVTGAVNFDLSGMGLHAKVANAAPGVVLMLIGLAIIWRTNLNITAAKAKAK